MDHVLFLLLVDLEHASSVLLLLDYPVVLTVPLKSEHLYLLLVLLLLLLCLSVELLYLHQLLVEVLDALLHLGLVLLLNAAVEGVEVLEQGDDALRNGLGVHVPLLVGQYSDAALDEGGDHGRSGLFLLLHPHLYLLQTGDQLHYAAVAALFPVADVDADLVLGLSLLLLLRFLPAYSQAVGLLALGTGLIRK